MRGEVEVEDKVLVLKRIHVVYNLKTDGSTSAEDRETVDRVHEIHHNYCPIYRSISAAIDITTELQIVEG